MSSINDLRAALFAELARINAGASDPERTRQVVSTAQVLVNLAKVEVDYLKTAGGGTSSFIEPDRDEQPVRLQSTAAVRRVEGGKTAARRQNDDPWSTTR